MLIKQKPVYYIIPYRGSEIRNKNLIEVLNYLNSIFEDINIIVGEHDTENRIDLTQYDNLQHFFIKCEDNVLFDRTGTINFLIKKCPDNTIIVNNDSDCILSKSSYMKAFSMINSGSHDYVVPYSGRCYNVRNDFKFDRELKSGEYLRWSNAIGGVIIFNKEFYQNIGLENENIISWGYEDFERFYRVLKLNDYKRIVTPSPPDEKIHLLNKDFYNEDLYHYDHDKIRDENSNKNPNKDNNKKIYEFIKVVPKEKLKAIIDKWEWKKNTDKDNEYVLLKHANIIHDKFQHQLLDDIRKIETYQKTENIYTAIDDYSKEIFKRGYNHYYRLYPDIMKSNIECFSNNYPSALTSKKYMTFVYTIADNFENLKYSINSLVYDSDFFDFFDIVIIEQNSNNNLNINEWDLDFKDKIQHIRILDNQSDVKGYHNYAKLMNFAVYNFNTELMCYVSSDHLFQPKFYYELNKTCSKLNFNKYNLFVNSFDISKNDINKHLIPRNYMKIYKTLNLKNLKGFNELMSGFSSYIHTNIIDKMSNNLKINTLYSMFENPKLFVLHNFMYNNNFYYQKDKHNNIDVYNKKVSNFLYNISVHKMQEGKDYKKLIIK